MSAFEELPQIAPTVVWDGILGRAVHGERLTMAVIELAANTELPEHAHDNEQLGLLLSGSLELRVGAESRNLVPGEMWRIASNVRHSGVAGPGGAVVVDVFAPAREDWLGLEHVEPRPPIWP